MGIPKGTNVAKNKPGKARVVEADRTVKVPAPPADGSNDIVSMMAKVVDDSKDEKNTSDGSKGKKKTGTKSKIKVLSSDKQTGATGEGPSLSKTLTEADVDDLVELGRTAEASDVERAAVKATSQFSKQWGVPPGDLGLLLKAHPEYATLVNAPSGTVGDITTKVQAIAETLKDEAKGGKAYVPGELKKLLVTKGVTEEQAGVVLDNLVSRFGKTGNGRIRLPEQHFNEVVAAATQEAKAVSDEFGNQLRNALKTTRPGVKVAADASGADVLMNQTKTVPAKDLMKTVLERAGVTPKLVSPGHNIALRQAQREFVKQGGTVSDEVVNNLVAGLSGGKLKNKAAASPTATFVKERADEINRRLKQRPVLAAAQEADDAARLAQLGELDVKMMEAAAAERAELQAATAALPPTVKPPPPGAAVPVPSMPAGGASGRMMRFFRGAKYVGQEAAFGAALTVGAGAVRGLANRWGNESEEMQRNLQYGLPARDSAHLLMQQQFIAPYTQLQNQMNQQNAAAAEREQQGLAPGDSIL